MKKIKEFVSKLWAILKTKMKESYTWVQALTNGNVIFMIALAMVYFVLASFVLVVMGTKLMVAVFGLNFFTEIFYPMTAFCEVAGLYIAWVIIGSDK